MKATLFGVLAAVLYFYFALSFWYTLLSVFILYLLTGGWRYTRAVILTTPRDTRGLFFLIHSKSTMSALQRNGDNIITLFQNTVHRHPDKTALIMLDERKYTFREVDEFSNSVANYFYEQGFRKGDVVALFMENCPEYVGMWLGLAKIGVITALINFNLRMETLVHCIRVANARAVIYGTELKEAVDSAKSLMPSSLSYFFYGDAQTVDGLGVHLNPALDKSSKRSPPKYCTISLQDKLVYVYTSGTTGLPKAAVILHSRFFYMHDSIHWFFKMRPDDIIYDTLPLYHTAGGILGIGQCLIKGCTVVIRKKFSASRYWEDCVKYNCTIGQYIGEICRYLLAQPPKMIDRQHKVRVVFGNGIRPQIWTEFKERFGIERIGEFYGATEGNAHIANINNQPGAIGFQSIILPWAYPVTLIKVDQDTGELVRDRNGLCIRCQPGECGEMVGKVIKGQTMREFDGYADPEASKKKIAHNIFQKGDTYFLTGDILEMDEFGYMYFKDRSGDTFRWKGENVSTSEVEAVISNIVKLKDAVAYGIEVPGAEGRAGMVAILDENHQIDLKQLSYDMRKSLPAYARPLFIRILDKLDLTGTFKLRKIDYRKDGFDPAKVKDKLYYLDPKSGIYQALDDDIYQQICKGVIRF